MKNLSAILQAFRRELPGSSLTEQALDRSAAWEGISVCAQAEGLGNLAVTLFEAEQKKARELAG